MDPINKGEEMNGMIISMLGSVAWGFICRDNIENEKVRLVAALAGSLIISTISMVYIK